MTEKLQALWAQWGDSILAAIPRILQALVVIVIVLLIDDRLQRGVEGLVGRRGQRELGRLLGRLVRIGVLLFGLLVVLGIFKQTEIVASFVASLGVAGLVIAFALQDITKNFAAGVLLLIQRPFGLDDHIKVGAYEGIVTDINLRATALRTPDGHEVLIPNAEVYSGAIMNLTHYQQRRITVSFTLPLTVEAQTALPRLEAALAALPLPASKTSAKALPPPPAVVVVGFDKDVWSCEARVWTPSPTDTTALTTAINVRLREAVAALA